MPIFLIPLFAHWTQKWMKKNINDGYVIRYLLSSLAIRTLNKEMKNKYSKHKV